MERQHVFSYFFAFFLFIAVDSFSGVLTFKKIVSYPSAPLLGKTRVTVECKGSYDDIGLLKGVEYDADVKDGERGKYYTPDLNMSSLRNFHWINAPGYAWEAAKEDAEMMGLSPQTYLDCLSNNMLAFQVSDEVFDREELYSFLNGTIKKRGSFALVLGGKSVGKSLVLKNYVEWLKNETGVFPMLVNFRLYPGSPLATAILEVYKNTLKRLIGFNLKVDRDDMIKAVGGILDITLKSGAKEVKNIVQSGIETLLEKNTVTSKTALESFIQLAEGNGSYPVLFIDEANLAKDLGNPQEERKEDNPMLNTLQTIVSLTKETKSLSVIMASSEHAYPYKLENSSLNLLDIKDKIFAREIPPSSMWQLLVKEEKEEGEKVIGMGPSLAKVMMSAYGGHYYRMLDAVCDLSEERGRFVLNQRLNEIGQKITTCLEGGGHDSEKLLYSMARYGFADVMGYKDGNVRQISQEDIGGVASSQGSKIVGVDRLRLKEDYALLPTSESARIVIALKLLKRQKERKEREEKEIKELKEKMDRRRWWHRIFMRLK